MKPHRLAALPLLTLTLAAATAEAQTTVMDFSTLPSFGNGAAAPEFFGSHANLTVDHLTRTGFGNTTLHCASVSLLNAGYSSLPAAAYPCQNHYVGELQFLPLNGLSVTLNSMNFGSYNSVDGVGPVRNLTVKVYDDAWNELYSFTGSVSFTLPLLPAVSSSNGLYLQWGDDWSTGVNDISTTVSNQSVVSEPASVLLVTVGLMGLGCVGVVRRRLNRENDPV